jgi:hypothetical protein
LKKIFVAANFWEVFWIMITLQLNIVLCLDLVLMIKYPFNDKESRLKYYIWSSFSVAFFIGVANVVYLNAGESKRWPYIIYIGWFTFFLAMAIYSTIYAGCKLIRPGISGQVRTLILKRHFLCIFFFMISNVYLLVVSITYAENPSY